MIVSLVAGMTPLRRTKMRTEHNPTNFDPTNYEVVDYLDNKRPEYRGQLVEHFVIEVKAWEAEMEMVLGSDWRAKMHRCIHCGNGSVRWITAVRHLPTDTVVVFGADCTARLGFADRMTFKLALLKSRADTATKTLKAYLAKEAYLNEHPELRTAIEEAKNPVHARNTFAADVVSKFERFGSLSEAQLNALTKSLQRDYEFEARRLAEASEAKGDAPSGRVEVCGRVLTVKEVETGFGFSKKMLLKLENNAKVWLTVPSGSDVNRDDVVRVKATFTVSRDDKHFAFGSRPTGLEKVSA
jgi:hypothetical protein